MSTERAKFWGDQLKRAAEGEDVQAKVLASITDWMWDINIAQGHNPEAGNWRNEPALDVLFPERGILLDDELLDECFSITGHWIKQS